MLEGDLDVLEPVMILNLTGIVLEGENSLVISPSEENREYIIHLCSFRGIMPTRRLLRESAEALIAVVAMEFDVEVSDDEESGQRKFIRGDRAVLIGGPFCANFLLSTLEFMLMDKIGVRVLYPVLETIDDERGRYVKLLGCFEPAVHLELEAEESDVEDD